MIGLEKYASPDMLRLALKATKVPSLKDDATTIAMVMAQRLAGNPAEAKKLLGSMSLKSVKIEIIKAEYGAGSQQKDVTATLQRCVGRIPWISLPSSKYNEAFGGDPASGTPKQLKVKYRIDGKEGEATFAEDAAIILPTPK